MKNPFTSFLNKPILVASVSVVIAAVIGGVGYVRINQAPEYQFVKAGVATLQDLGSVGDGSAGERHLTLSFLTSGRITGLSVKAGDTVAKGEVLATLDPESTLGSLTQAKAAYASAQAAYNKVVNGATSPDIEVSKTALATAQTALTQAKENLLQKINENYTSSQVALNTSTGSFFTNPDSDTPKLQISGVTFNDQLLQLKIENERVSLTHLLPNWKKEVASASVNADLVALTQNAKVNLQATATYLDDLSTLFTNGVVTNSGSETTVSADLALVTSARASITAALSALNTASQAVQTSASAVSQSQSSLTLKTSGARPEDIAAASAQVSNALGTVQIATAAYNNRTIVAPGDGKVTAVYVSVGETAAPNAPAIELSGKTFTKEVAVAVPNSAISRRDDKTFVKVKTANGVEEREVIVGASDTSNTEVLSGLSVGDEVVIH